MLTPEKVSFARLSRRPVSRLSAMNRASRSRSLANPLFSCSIAAAIRAELR